MHIGRKIRYVGYALLLFLWISLCYKNIVTAQQSQNNNMQTVSSNASGGSTTKSWWNFSDALRYILNLSPAGIFAIINIYKFCIERKYEISSISIKLINENIAHDDKYPQFYCEKVIVDEKEIKKREIVNPYYLDVEMIINTSNTRNKIRNIVIKGIELDMDGYRLRYKGEGFILFGYKKCRVDRQNGACSLLFKYPSIKKVNGVSKINPVRHFQNPENVRLIFKWANNFNIFSIFGFLFPKSTNVEFKKTDNQNNSALIGIESIKIY